MVRIADYPQLALIAWNRDRDGTIDDAEALALYERNWHLVDREAMSVEEKRFLERLVEDHGHGVLNV